MTTADSGAGYVSISAVNNSAISILFTIITGGGLVIVAEIGIYCGICVDDITVGVVVSSPIISNFGVIGVLVIPFIISHIITLICIKGILSDGPYSAEVIIQIGNISGIWAITVICRLSGILGVISRI